jgi:hypothetical protein
MCASKDKSRIKSKDDMRADSGDWWAFHYKPGQLDNATWVD